ncbi:MAG: hypothetical protein AAF634_10330 [Bacteroidota bacterium]
MLLFPTTPLLTIATRTFGNLTLQFESNFVNTLGLNLNYFSADRMHESYLFTGLTFVENELLRKDVQIIFLPYLGYE